MVSKYGAQAARTNKNANKKGRPMPEFIKETWEKTTARIPSENCPHCGGKGANDHCQRCFTEKMLRGLTPIKDDLLASCAVPVEQKLI
jgi:hypothetical protein